MRTFAQNFDRVHSSAVFNPDASSSPRRSRAHPAGCFRRALRLNLFEQSINVQDRSVVRGGRIKTVFYLLGMLVGLAAFIYDQLQRRSRVLVDVVPFDFAHWQQLSAQHPDGLSCSCSRVSSEFESFLPPFPNATAARRPLPGVQDGYSPEVYDWVSIGAEPDDRWCAAHLNNTAPGSWWSESFLSSPCTMNFISSQKRDWVTLVTNSMWADTDHFTWIQDWCAVGVQSRLNLFEAIYGDSLASANLMSPQAFASIVNERFQLQWKLAQGSMRTLTLSAVPSMIVNDAVFGPSKPISIPDVELLAPFQSCGIAAPELPVITYTREEAEQNFDVWTRDSRGDRNAAYLLRRAALSSPGELFWNQLPYSLLTGKGWTLNEADAYPLYYQSCAPSMCYYAEEQRVGTMLLLSALIGVAGGLDFLLRLAVALVSRTLHVCCDHDGSSSSSSSKDEDDSATINSGMDYSRFPTQ